MQMLSAANTAIEKVLPYFSERGLDVCFLVPTLTGIEKSIMDATGHVRKFLERNDLHYYDMQKQGSENKVSIPAFIVSPNCLIDTQASLYRPQTKKGDPRIWFQGLKKYVNPYDLLGIVSNGAALFVFDLSDKIIVASLETSGFAAKTLDDIARQDASVSNELLDRLRRINKLGFVNTVVRGDTGIGMTLESLLGIPPNSSAAPDYKGIELKASRTNYRTGNRVNLFSKIPDWKNSKIKTAVELLNIYGYIKDGRRQLYCTLSSNPNSQGLYFDVDDEKDLLINKYQTDIDGDFAEIDVVQWKIESLRDALNKKHNETFWVKATARTENGIESFRFEKVVHTRKPNSSLFSIFIEENIITMDYLLHMEAGRARDHGYLFKIKPNNIELLFPKPKYYDLSK